MQPCMIGKHMKTLLIGEKPIYQLSRVAAKLV